MLSRIMSIRSFRRKLFKHSAFRSLPLAPLLASPPIPSTIRTFRRLLFRKLASLPTDKLRMRAWHASCAFCFRDLDFRINFRTLGLRPLPSIALPSIGHRVVRQSRQQMPLFSNVKSILSFFTFDADGSDGCSAPSAPSEPRCLHCARRCDDSWDGGVSMVASIVAAVGQHGVTRLSVVSFDDVRAAFVSIGCRSLTYTFDLHWAGVCTSQCPVDADAEGVAVGWAHGASAVAENHTKFDSFNFNLVNWQIHLKFTYAPTVILIVLQFQQFSLFQSLSFCIEFIRHRWIVCGGRRFCFWIGWNGKSHIDRFAATMRHHNWFTNRFVYRIDDASNILKFEMIIHE